MKKKGFTLIEIIVAISLIAVIGVGSFIGIKLVNNNIKNKKIDKVYSVFDNALEVYLSENSEIYNNLSKNVEGAVITLEVLKNEGLVNDNIIDPITNEKIDYKNNYYVLSDAVLLQDPVEGEDSCEGQVSIEVLKSWKDLSETGIDTSKVLYICPKTNTDEENKEIEALEERIKNLEHALSLSNLGSKNYVTFDVNYNENATISWANTDLWRIVSTENGIKLMYDQEINYNFPKNVLEKYKQDVLCKEPECDVSSDRIYLYDSNNVSIGSLASLTGSKYLIKVYGRNEKNGQELRNCYVYDNNVYCYESIRVTTSKYKYKSNINDFIMQYGYINKEQYTKLKDKSDINFISEDLIEKDSYHLYNIGDLFGLNYYSIFNLNTNDDKSIKKTLYNQINTNIVNAIEKHDYKYSYTMYSDTGEIFYNNKVLNDFIGTINFSEGQKMIEKDISSFIGKKITIGTIPLGSGFSSVPSIFYFENTLYKAAAPINTADSYYNHDMGKVNFYPTIKLKSSSKLLTNINDYPTEYQTTCLNKELGTKDCPYLIKIGNYYSNGQIIN